VSPGLYPLSETLKAYGESSMAVNKPNLTKMMLKKLTILRLQMKLFEVYDGK
jgi:hypothetical protein